jgi:hypothetical protein
MAAGPQTAVPASAIPYQRPFEAGQAVVTDDDDKIPAGRLAAGLTLGLVAGVIMSLIVMKIAFYAHLNLSLLYVGIGYGVGFAIYKVTGQGGAGLAFGGSALMALGLLIGHLVYASDVLGAYRQELGLSDSATIFSAFGPLMATLSLRHWMCVAIGLGACFRAIEAQDGKG